MNDIENLEGEVWKEIPNAWGYKISNMGRFCKPDGTIRRHSTNPSGYYIAVIVNKGRLFAKTIHRLVAEAFIPNHENKPCLNHINEDKTDNRAENLEWCTYLENNKHGTRIKRVLDITSENGSYNARCPINQYDLQGNFIQTFESISEAERTIGKRMSVALYNKSHFAQGYIWAYATEAPIGNGKPRKVLQYTKSGEFVKEWESIQAAAKSVGVCTASVHKVLNGSRTLSGGYMWRYKEENKIGEV